MLSTSARLLRLVTLLQTQRHWTGAALVDALVVDARTVRRDVERLRELGYPVEASPGVGGGYSLGRGTGLPPLLLDDEEAVALAIALRAASASIGGIEATSLRLLTKLDQLLPSRLRRRASALHSVTLSLRHGEPLVDAELLSTLACACRDSRALEFTYTSHGAVTSTRQVCPLRLVNYGRRWYLVAWDESRSDWRTFRADRIVGAPRLGAAFAPMTPPPDVQARLERSIAYAPFPYRVTLRLHGHFADLATSVPTWCGILEADGPEHCLLRVGAESPEALAAHVLMVGHDAQLVEGHELLAPLGEVTARLATLFSIQPATDGGRIALEAPAA